MAIAETARLFAELALKDKLSPGLGKAVGNLNKTEGAFGRVARGAGQVQSGLFKAGTRIAAAAIVAGGAAAKIAIDFDDAFASVRKNVEGTEPELQGLSDALHNMATRIPVKFQDLTAIAAEAGALGIATKDVSRFTETIARLSASTQGLTVEAASEAFGKFRNSLHLTEDEIERSASALVTLGKTAGSSEGDIIEVAKRFAGAGSVAGLSAAQVLGLSSAISSLGVAPEAAGGSLSRLFNKINLFIGTGDKKLKTFANTAGLSEKAFEKAFGRDALGTFEKFLQGLSKLSGPEQAKRLKSAGIVNSRDISALQLLAASWQEVGRQTDAASESYRRNTDLADTSNKRFQTLASSLTTIGNSAKEVGFQIGEGMTPALTRAAEKIQKLLQDPAIIAKARSIGEEIGRTIDDIDWQQVIDGAKSFADALSPALTLTKNILSAINALPASVKGAGLGFLALNKLSGGLIGEGVGNIVGGIGGALGKGALGHVPGVSSLVATPVRVVNWPVGGLGGVGGAGGTGGKLGTLGKIGLGAEAIGAIASVVVVQQQISGELSAMGKGLQGRLTDVQAKPGRTDEQIAVQLAAVNKGINDIQANPLNVLVQGSALDSLRSMRDSLVSEQTKRDQDNGLLRDTDKLNGPIVAATDQSKNVLQGAVNDGRVATVQSLARVESATNDGKTATVSSLATLDSSTRSGASLTSGAARGAGFTVAAAVAAAAATISAAVWAARPVIQATTINQTNVRNSRYGPSGSSRTTNRTGQNIPGGAQIK